MKTATRVNQPRLENRFLEPAMERRQVSISPALAALTAAVGVVTAGYAYGLTEYAWTVGAFLLMAAIGFFFNWVQSADHQKSRTLRGLEWIRRAMAYDPPAPAPRDR
jgi:hypothetical protein